MRITTNEGEFELVRAYREHVSEPITYTLKPIEPVKKTEEETKFIYRLEFTEIGIEDLYSNKLPLTLTTANKLSEAISALVDVATGKVLHTDKLSELAIEAAKSYQRANK